MIKKKYLLLFLCLIMFVTDVSQVNAGAYIAGNTSGNVNGGNNSTGGNGSGANSNPWIDGRYGDRKIMYRYSISIPSNWYYEIDDKDINGNDQYSSITKSGTWIGIYIHEVQQASWTVSNFEFKEVKRTYKCIKKMEGKCTFGWPYFDPMTGKTLRDGDPGYNRWLGRKCDPDWTDIQDYGERNYYESFTCPTGYERVPGEKEVPLTDNSIIESFKNTIYKSAHDTAVSLVGPQLSKVQITTEELDSNNKYKTIIIDGVETEFQDAPIADHGYVQKVYSYKPDSICINLKTGKVSYNKGCQSEEEVRIQPFYYGGKEYWQYFSPLNMKSGSNLNLVILGGRPLTDDECQSFKDSYGSNAGNYIDSSCRLSMTLSYNVVQKYYYEETKNNQIKFNGYNLYYRPININNPFPTIPTENSLWYKWYNSKDKSPNLKDSFNEVTYSVDVPNKLADTIRAYNVNNPYPSFDKLSLSGTSDFLRSIGVEALTKDKKYGLGGGTRTCVKNGTVSIGSDCS